MDTNQFVADSLIVVLGVLVHPDLGQTHRVTLQHVDAGAPLVGRPLAEDVADVRAGHDLQGAATHPRLQITQLYITQYLQFNCILNGVKWE